MTCVGVLESDDLARSSVCLCSYRSWIQPSLFSHVYIQRSGLTIWESIKKKSVLLPILIKPSSIAITSVLYTSLIFPKEILCF